MQKILGHILDSRPGRRGKHSSSSFPGQSGDEGQPSSTPTLDPEFPIGAGTYPRLAHLSDGSLLAITTRRAPEDNAVRILQISRAEPGWDTAQPPRFDRWGEVTRGAGDVDNGFILELPNNPTNNNSSPGTPPVVLAAFRNHSLDPSTGRPTHFRITVCYSLDRGRTWSFLSQAAEQPAHPSGLGLWEPFMRLSYSSSSPPTKPPVVHLTYSAELAHNNQETFLTTLSTTTTTPVPQNANANNNNNNNNWQWHWHPTPPTCLGCHDRSENLRDGMQGVASLGGLSFFQDKDKNKKEKEILVMVMETTRHAPGLMSVEYVLSSSDDGQTWGGRGEREEDRGVVYVPTRPNRNAGSPQVASVSVYDDDGTGKGGGRKKLAVVFMTDEDLPDDQLGWPGRAAVKMVFCEGGLSLEEGKKKKLRWSHPPLEIAGDSAHWPGILESGAGRPGEVLVSYERKGVGAVGRRVRF